MSSPFKKKKKVSKFSRYQTVLRVLMKYGYDDLVTSSSYSKYIPTWRKIFRSKKKPDKKISRYERIRLILEELGPTYIKFGQIMSNRADLLPDELIFELEKLQEKSKPLDAGKVREILTEEYGKPVDQVFDNFQEEPLASASIAQVHKANLLSGQPVVVKVQRPNIREKIMADIRIMIDVATLAERRYPEVAVIQPLELIEQFKLSIINEMNFHKEVLNIRRFSKNFNENEEIYVPHVYGEYCTENIICMEYIEGIKVSNLNKLRSMNFDLEELSYKIIDLYFKQIFDHGFFHADPHPGNLYVMRTGKICFLDYGMMGNLMPRDRELMGEMVINIGTKNIKKLSYTIQQIAMTQPLENPYKFERDLFELIEEYEGTILQQVNMSEVIERFRNILYENNIPLPATFYLLMRAMVIIEGVGKLINPKYNIIKNLQPYAEELIVRKYNPVRLMREFYESAENFSVLVSDFPKDFKAILKKVKRGKLHIEFEHQNLEPFYKSLDSITNRLSFAVVIAAMMIGSALIVLAGIPPFLFNVPLLGFIGFFVSALMALWLVISIIRHGKM